ncbi:MAG: DUF2922 domain-containing protein [Methylocystaceae bacterium]
MAQVKVLEMDFVNTAGKNATIRVLDPRDNLTQAEVEAAMDVIIAQNVFTLAGGDLVSKKGAQVVTRDTTELFG